MIGCLFVSSIFKAVFRWIGLDLFIFIFCFQLKMVVHITYSLLIKALERTIIAGKVSSDKHPLHSIDQIRSSDVKQFARLLDCLTLMQLFKTSSKDFSLRN